ncbi:D-cysteine desulfhydrase family protein [Streptomyces triculaminicus]|uniref:D-cysteine desulfhydrase family protein n=3 Tax=Streptomyces TaxID=1883 RepID=A0A939FNJ1_9ACTN|nr:D-cysteine desulfhydrase family protein [Streptomyces triculaminicus]QSY52670.1 D-cysteine desulfhydrase family protein [Streptomyces griseocarneus]
MKEFVVEKVTLSAWPTPMEAAPRLAQLIGLAPDDLWIKRDDLTGLGGGGNKVRKLEWLVADALQRGADTLVTTGGPQSNHARLTAAAGARAGLNVVLVMPGSGRPDQPGGNLLLDAAFAARIVWAGDATPAELAGQAEKTCAELREEGAVPYLVPFGGSGALGARGYREAGEEILTQQPDVRHVVTALGSGGTMAGLVAALGTERVLGVDVGALPEPASVTATFASELTGSQVTAEQLRCRGDQVGEAYGILYEPVLEAITTVARTEGIILDPVYTGRAAAGLIAAVRDGSIRPGERTVLLHTGGLPGLFGHAEAAHRIGQTLHTYP